MGTMCELLPRGIEAVSFQLVSQKGAKPGEVRAFALCARGQTHSGRDLSSKVRRQSRVENERARAVDQETAQWLRPADERARGSERFAAGVDRGKHAAGKPGLRDAAAAVRSADADGMGLINDEFRAMSRGKHGEIDERRAVAIHAENAFDHNESRPGSGMVAAKFDLRER